MSAERREFENCFENWDPSPTSKLHARLGMLQYDNETHEWKSLLPGISNWEPASFDAGPLFSEPVGVGVSSAASESSGRRWPASTPDDPRTGACSLPPSVRRQRDLADPRPQSGLSLRTFNNSETRLPRLSLPSRAEVEARRRRARRATSMLPENRQTRLKQARRDARFTAAATAVKQAPVTNCAVARASVAATAVRGATATSSASAAPAAAPVSRLGSTATSPEPRTVSPPPARHRRRRGPSASATNVVKRLRERAAQVLAALELRQLCFDVSTSQLFVRSRQ